MFGGFVKFTARNWHWGSCSSGVGHEKEFRLRKIIHVGMGKTGTTYLQQKVFPELSSGSSPSKPRTKSRPPVAPTTGGSSNYKGNRVRMSQEQLKMARELGITDEKGLKQYEAEIRRQKGAR